MKVLWIDTETTGLDPDKHGIIQLAMIVDIDGQIKGKETFTMCPTGRASTKEALEVNGYTQEQIRGFELWENVYHKVTEFMSRFVDKFKKEDKFILGGQNVGFDCDMMKSWFEYCDDKYWFSWVKAGAYIDTLPTVTFLQWQGKVPILKSRKNSELCKHFGIALDNAHDAMADIEATRAVAYKMKGL